MDDRIFVSFWFKNTSQIRWRKSNQIKLIVRAVVAAEDTF